MDGKEENNRINLSIFENLMFENCDQDNEYPLFEKTMLTRLHRKGHVLYEDLKHRFISTSQLNEILEYLEPTEEDDIGLVQYIYNYFDYNKENQIRYDKEYLKNRICELIDNNYELIYK